MKFKFGQKVVVKKTKSFYDGCTGVVLKFFETLDNSYLVRFKTIDNLTVDAEVNEENLKKEERKPRGVVKK